ncbi:RING/U-box superfamily protein, partial [Striga hermonthica]
MRRVENSLLLVAVNGDWASVSPAGVQQRTLVVLVVRRGSSILMSWATTIVEESGGGGSGRKGRQREWINGRRTMAMVVAGEFSDDDVEKQRVNIVVGDGLAKAASVDESQDLVEKTIDLVVVDCANKGEPQLERSSTSHEECRVCQEENEEALINLGCQCRGGLAKAHQSCIIKWFGTRGSNKCEICQQIASNVAPPDSQ